ncbi:MAG: type II toxin-antitoxin system Phd/YefM family antitoxin [Propionibacteriaceae bacterium]|jgi:antitoxin (DNA-binding transcriptional repressor) of toxin-antitoxin stability system|nr:type II toxin-antitoxin system Phd/YefM family antitoxin [Propionibacteriaceae bacterium]
MTILSLTEFNQNPSRVVRLLEDDPRSTICVTKRGKPILQVTAIRPTDDPITTLVARGLASLPARASCEPVQYGDDLLPSGLDLMTSLDHDRNRLD